jgi:uncharacterized protein YjbI with pentapeptide repeats
MNNFYIQDKLFKHNDAEPVILQRAEYENCTFTGLHLLKADLRDYKFTDCTFISCNLSLAILENTSLQGIMFKDCKLQGVHFDKCNDFGLDFSFDSCILSHCSFYKKRIRDTMFNNCQMQEADFTGTDLTNCIFNNCNLENAIFNRTVLEKADLHTAYNYSLDPEINRIRKAVFSAAGLAGLLGKYELIIR